MDNQVFWGQMLQLNMTLVMSEGYMCLQNTFKVEEIGNSVGKGGYWGLIGLIMGNQGFGGQQLQMNMTILYKRRLYELTKFL